MKEEILSICRENHTIIDSEMLSFLLNLNQEDIKKILNKLISNNQKILTKNYLIENFDFISEIIEDKGSLERIKNQEEFLDLLDKIKKQKEKNTLEKQKEEKLEKTKQKINENSVALGNKIKVLYSLANVTRKITAQDFISNFRNRFQEMKKFIQDRKELQNLTSINKLGNKRQDVSIIGLVYDKRVTKNKNIILEVEDLTGRLKVLISHEKEEIFQKAKEILLDDIIGIRGFGDDEILFVNEIVYPEANKPEKTSLSLDENVAVISDVHFGSKNFLKENFEKFINWINGNVEDEKQKKEALKTKTLFMVGDNVDGIGIYPGQEEDLEVKNMKEQYKEFVAYLKKIRKEVNIIICPGQHDATRVAEPQPPIDREYAPELHEMENVILVSNPALIEIIDSKGKGLKFQMYHGASMHYIIDGIETLRTGNANENPSIVVKEILKRRHLSPTHSSSIYIPLEKEDPLLISETPDIILTGEMHRTDFSEKNNIQIICSSCWQAKTAFEEKVGNNPDPCKVPLLNLKTRKIKILDFSSDKEEI
jgi:DNA polymerase II small subunit